MKKYHFLLFFATIISCSSQLGTSSEDFIQLEPIEIILRKDVFIDKGIFQISYNEEFQQPNWVEYVASNRPKNVSRGDLDFFSEPNVYTSDNNDYRNNPWDRGHMAPAATFADTFENIQTTFTYANCAMQWDQLNQGEWVELEKEIRAWSVEGDVKVRITLVFEENHIIRETGVHIPTGFEKKLTFADNTTRCFYFPNEDTDRNWDEYEVTCGS